MDVISYFGFIFVAILVIVVIFLQKKEKNNSAEKDLQDELLPYRRKYLLTKNEWWFYKSLKDVAEKFDCTILAKIRLADLVEVSADVGKQEYFKYFAKIKAKHIDFVLCKKDNLYPELLIELNDNSHKRDDRIKRDDFIKRVVEKVGYKIIFVSGTQNLQEEICKVLQSGETNKENNTPFAQS